MVLASNVTEIENFDVMKLSFIILLILPMTVFSQTISVKSFTNTESSFKIQGKFVKGINWRDSLGDNHLILSATDPFKKIKGSRKLDIDLYAYHFLKDGSIEKQVWMMKDSQNGCPEMMDIMAKFISDGIAITDLDKNGKSEIWLIYKMSCRTDVRPAKMKIVMYEAEKKYTMSGENRVPYIKDKYIGGQKEMDANFKNGLKEFRDYGLKLWQEFINEDFK